VFRSSRVKLVHLWLHLDSHTTLKTDSAIGFLDRCSGWVSCLQSEVSERLFNVFLRFAFYLEPFAPPAISYYISRRLDAFHQQGLINGYKANTKRLGKFHYKVEVDLDVTARQAIYVIDDLLPDQLKRLRR